MGFELERLNDNELNRLRDFTRKCRADILKMTTLANSGHPGGSLSSVDIYAVLWNYANISPNNFRDEYRDRIVISHGHTSPGVYAVLGNLGFFDIDDAIATFRLAGSVFEGHIERAVPGVEWATGNLGQGISAGAGMALVSRKFNYDFNVFVVMGDGEQQKGQIAEARRFISKYRLSNLTVIIDYNRLQISGNIEDVMPQNLINEYEADGFYVIEIDGHSFDEIYNAIKKAHSIDKPVMILAHTVMGKGISFMENKHEYHGKPLNRDEFSKAMKELGFDDDLSRYEKIREKGPRFKGEVINHNIRVLKSFPRVYKDKIDNRTAFGNALIDIARTNVDNLKILVFDCDLAGSVKTAGFKKEFGDNFVQVGIQEHNTAVIAGAVSTQGVLSFWADFGVFGVDETYNQARLNDINHTEVKVVCTHCGLDVGEDGKTHQCIDYVGLFRNLKGFKIIVPIDPNHTDRVIKYVAENRGNFLVAMGRSKMNVVLDEFNEIFFDKDYNFEYGKMDYIRKHENANITVFAVGQMVIKALSAYAMLVNDDIYINIIGVSSPAEIDQDILNNLCKNDYWITYEDHLFDTGFGSTLAFYMVENAMNPKLIRMGVKDYGISGKSEDVFKYAKLSPLDLYDMIKSLE